MIVLQISQNFKMDMHKIIGIFIDLETQKYMLYV